MAINPTKNICIAILLLVCSKEDFATGRKGKQRGSHYITLQPAVDVKTTNQAREFRFDNRRKKM